MLFSNYSFNGKEKDDEWSGDGNHYDYGERVLDPRLGRFLSVDPLSSKFPFYSPFHYAGNKPIVAIDIDGLEDIYYMESFNKNVGKVAIELFSATDMGRKFNEDFKRITPATNPDGTVDPGNQGVDLFVVSTVYYESKGGQTNYLDTKTVISIRDETGTDKTLTVKDAIVEARTKKSGYLYDMYKNILSEEVLNSDALGKTLDNNRDITIARISPDFYVEPDQGVPVKTKSGRRAYALGHELIAHVFNNSRHDFKRDEHLDFNGSSGDVTVIGKGTPASRLGIQLRKAEIDRSKNKDVKAQPKIKIKSTAKD